MSFIISKYDLCSLLQIVALHPFGPVFQQIPPHDNNDILGSCIHWFLGSRLINHQFQYFITVSIYRFHVTSMTITIVEMKQSSLHKKDDIFYWNRSCIWDHCNIHAVFPIIGITIKVRLLWDHLISIMIIMITIKGKSWCWNGFQGVISI